MTTAEAEAIVAAGRLAQQTGLKIDACPYSAKPGPQRESCLLWIRGYVHGRMLATSSR